MKHWVHLYQIKRCNISIYSLRFVSVLTHMQIMRQQITSLIQPYAVKLNITLFTI